MELLCTKRCRLKVERCPDTPQVRNLARSVRAAIGLAYPHSRRESSLVGAQHIAVNRSGPRRSVASWLVVIE